MFGSGTRMCDTVHMFLLGVRTLIMKSGLLSVNHILFQNKKVELILENDEKSVCFTVTNTPRGLNPKVGWNLLLWSIKSI